MFELFDLVRRLDNLIRLGRVCELDAIAARVKVKSGAITTAWLPWLTQHAGENKTWWCPSINEQVLILAPGGELHHGVVICGLYQNKYPAPSQHSSEHSITYADGTVLRYDTDSHILSVTATGSMTLNIKGPLTVQVEGALQLQSAIELQLQAPAIAMQSTSGKTKSTLQGQFKLCGDLIVEGNIHASGDMLAQGQTSNHHAHP